MIKIIKIEKNFDIRLDKYLKNTFTSLTQSFIEKNIRKKNIVVNNSKTFSKYIVKKNDLLKISNQTNIKTFLVGESLLKNLDNNSIFSVL